MSDARVPITDDTGPEDAGVAGKWYGLGSGAILRFAQHLGLTSPRSDRRPPPVPEQFRSEPFPTSSTLKPSPRPLGVRPPEVQSRYRTEVIASTPSAERKEPTKPEPQAPPKVDPRYRIDVFVAAERRPEPPSPSRRVPETDDEIWAAFIDRVDPYEFEDVVLDAYERTGFHVRRTKASGDEGLDGVLYAGSEAIGLQVKRYKGRVGAPMVREFIGSLAVFELDRGIFVSTGRLTQQARKAARWHGVEILTGDPLRDLILGNVRPRVLEILRNGPAPRKRRARRG
jgi:restriction system protein